MYRSMKLHVALSICVISLFSSFNLFAGSFEAELNPKTLSTGIHNAIERHPEIFPFGLHVLKTSLEGTTAEVVFNEALLPYSESPAWVDEMLHALFLAIPSARSIKVYIQQGDEVVSLNELVRLRPEFPDEDAAPEAFLIEPVNDSSFFPVPGPLNGVRIAVSPGHGWTWTGSGWGLQRHDMYPEMPLHFTEDMSNARFAKHVISALERTGAYVFSCRERDFNTNERIVDNDDISSGFSAGEGWYESTYAGFNGGTYMVHPTSGDPDAPAAAFAPDFPYNGWYAVYVAYRAGENRATDARYEIRYAGGTQVVQLDQEVQDRRWVYVGSYPFEAGGENGQGVWLSPYSQEDGQVVIADSVKFGGGMGSLLREGESSGYPRWEEASRYWTEFAGAPSEVYQARSTERDSDVVARPLYANWVGADAYLSIHTNAGGGTGTETYMYDGNATAGSEQWRDIVHNSIVQAIRSEWDENWVNRGLKAGDYGEVRELTYMPGCLTEIGFHDNAEDIMLLAHPLFRETIGRAIAYAALNFFSPDTPLYPLPVRGVYAKAVSGGVQVGWQPQDDTTWGEQTEPDYYRIRIAQGLYPTSQEFVTTAETSYLFTDLEAGEAYSFTITAINSGGESLPSEPVVARVYPDRPVQVLLVNGFDRMDYYIDEEENTGEYILIHAKAILAAGEYGFVSCSNEAVKDGTVDLSSYAMVDWSLGEETRLDNEPEDFIAFSEEERTKLSAFVTNGGGLFVSGSEVGYDVSEVHSDDLAYMAFYQSVLKAVYVSDDADSYSFQGSSGSIFDGLQGSFDNGENLVYDVDFPDVINPINGSERCMFYGSNDTQGMATCRVGGSENVIYFGVPFETILTDSLRNQIMSRVLEALAGDPFIGVDGDMDSDLEYDMDNEITEFVVDGDEEIPVDGDIEESEQEEEWEEPGIDGDDVDEDTDFAEEENSETTPADEEEDITYYTPVDGDVPLCQPGYIYENGTCVLYGENDDGCGCRNSPQPSFSSMLIFSIVLLAGTIRRRKYGHRFKA